MSGSRALLDSNAIIHASNGTIDARKLLAGKDQYFASIITYIEVYAFDFEDQAEKEIVDRILRNLEIVELSRETADQTIIYRRSKTKKIKLPDAVILASAKVLGAYLITDNYVDFQNVDSSVNLIDLDDLKI